MSALLFPSCVLIFIIFTITPVFTLPHTEPPLIEGYPFIAIWNIPTDKCKQLHIRLDPAAFQVVTTPNMVPGQFLTIFYEKHLGHYPRAGTKPYKIYNGGIPKNSNLEGHLVKAKAQINQYICNEVSPGLSVIDWESWRPLWDRNWGSKRIYQKLSIADTLQITPFLSMNEILENAKKNFQDAGRLFMEETIHLGMRECPNTRWGFYLFPDCYNYRWNHPGYTGECSAKVQNQNNHLLWLWEQSTALFPSIYLHIGLKNSQKAKLFVRNRVQEAMRVSKLPKRPNTVPIFVYTKPLYREQTQKLLSMNDLVSTIGECAALGASGIVLWGAYKDYRNKGSCQALSEYLQSTLNPYIANVTAAAMLCSEVLCQGKGRCLRKNYNSTHYLHLNPAHFNIKRVDGKYLATGCPSAADMKMWAESFTCQCYTGSSCSPKLRYPDTVKHFWIQSYY